MCVLTWRATQVLFPGLEVPTGGDEDELAFKERTDDELKALEKRKKEKEKAKGGPKGAEARVAASIDEKFAHLMSAEDDFLPSANAGA